MYSLWTINHYLWINHVHLTKNAVYKLDIWHISFSIYFVPNLCTILQPVFPKHALNFVFVFKSIFLDKTISFQVTFVGNNIPVHPHVYSNGHICLSILTDDWSPALSVQSVCLSIVSMLSSCKEKQRPPDNAFYVKTCNKNPKKTKWWYHGELKKVLYLLLYCYI